MDYPTKNALKAWHREYEQGRDLQVVIELCTRQISAQAIAQKLAVSRPTLYKWKNQLLGREAPPSMKRQNDSPPDSERTELQRQVESLRRDIRQLQLEHDLLKKANELLN